MKMMYLNPEKNPSGGYMPLQSDPAEGLLAFPDEFIPVFYPGDKECAGFVTIEDDGETVTSCVWNEEAYQAYLASLPEPGPVPVPEPTEVEQIRADVDYLAIMTGVEL